MQIPCMPMRTLFALVAIAIVAIVTAPFVMASGTESQPQPQQEEKICPGTFGEYRVHCLAALKHTEG